MPSASSPWSVAELLEVVPPHAALRGVHERGVALRELAVLRDHYEIGRDVRNDSVGERRHDDARILGADALEAGAHVGALGRHERHALAHHVRAHERAVGVVVLEERDEARRDGDDLHRGDVHVLDVLRGLFAELGPVAARDALFGERAVWLKGRVGLGDDELLFRVGGEIFYRVGDLAADDLAVRRLDEAEAVDLRIDAERRDKADVRAFGRLDRADAAVVRRVDVANLEARPFAAEAAGAESGKTALVGEGRERVRLVHELRELAPREEVLDDGAERLGVDEAARHEKTGIGIVDRHALADEALGSRETDAALVLDEFAGRADAAVAEVVDVVHRLLADEYLEEKADRLDDVDAGLVESPQIVVHLADESEFLVDLVAADIAEIVVGKLEE